MQHLAEKMKKDIQRGLVLRYINTHFQPYTDSHVMLATEANNKVPVHLSIVGILNDESLYMYKS